MRLHKIVVFTALALSSEMANAQWWSYPNVRIPRTRDGKPNLTARAPRAAHGKPDISGVWQAEPTSLSEFARVLGNNRIKLQVDLQDVSKYQIGVFWGIKPEEQPLRPEAVAVMRQRAICNSAGDRDIAGIRRSRTSDSC